MIALGGTESRSEPGAVPVGVVSTCTSASWTERPDERVATLTYRPLESMSARTPRSRVPGKNALAIVPSSISVEVLSVRKGLSETKT